MLDSESKKKLIEQTREARSRRKSLNRTNSDAVQRGKTAKESEKCRDHLEPVVSERPAELLTAKEVRKLEDISLRKAVVALSESEEKFRKMFELSPYSTVVTDLRGNILACNRQFTRLHATAEGPDAQVGRNVSEFLAEHEHSTLFATIDKTIAGRETQRPVEYTMLREDGTKFLAEARSTVVLDGQGQPQALLAIAHDITNRKRAEEALRESEKRYETVVENAGEGIVVVQDAKLQFVNPYVEAIFGHTQEELSSCPFVEFVHPDDRERVMGIHLRRFKGEEIPPFYELRVIDRHGGTRWVENNGILIEWNGRPATLNFLRDITDRKKAGEALRKSEQQYRRLVDTCPHGIQEADRHGNITFANEACHRIYGYEDGGLLGKNICDLPASEHERRRLRSLVEHLAEERPEPSAYFGQSLTKDGRVIDIQVDWDYTLGPDGLVEGYTSIITDVTEQKRAMETLRRSEIRHRELFDNMSSGVAVYEPVADGKDFVFKDFNRAAERINGVKKEDVVGRRVTEMFPAVKKFGLLEVFRRVCRTGKPEHHPVSLYKDERIALWFENYVYKLPSGEIIAVHDDVTANKQAQQELLQDRAQLKSLASQLSRVEERERHRLATALHDQIGQALVFSKLKLDELRTSSPSVEHAGALKEVCTSLENVIREMRTLTFDLSSPILYEVGFEAAVAEWLADEVKGKHGIEAEFCDDGQEKPLDDDIRALLFRNVRELLANVVKHARAHKVKVEIRRDAAHICVSIEDDGIGFDFAEVTAMAARGDKFGLFSIRERLEQLGGLIDIDSEPGRGSRVSMKAPLKSETLTDGIET
jgi:PAS domain S-box-containing protein